MNDSGLPEPRRFSHVIIMAGASCAGKTTLTSRLLNGDLPELTRALVLAPADTYHVLHGRDWGGVETATKDNVLVQYDLTARTPFAAEGEMTLAAIDLVNRAQRVTILTVWEQPDELKRRLEGRFNARGGLTYTLAQSLAKRRFRLAWHSLRRFHQRKRVFGRPDELWALYQRWFSSCARIQDAPHWVVRSSSPDAPMRLHGDAPKEPFWRS